MCCGDERAGKEKAPRLARGIKSFTCREALHPSFSGGDGRKVRDGGLALRGSAERVRFHPARHDGRRRRMVKAASKGSHPS